MALRNPEGHLIGSTDTTGEFHPLPTHMQELLRQGRASIEQISVVDGTPTVISVKDGTMSRKGFVVISLAAAGGLAGAIFVGSRLGGQGESIQVQNPQVSPVTTLEGQSPEATDLLSGFEALEIKYPGRFHVRVSVDQLSAMAGDNTLEVERVYKTAYVPHKSKLRIQKDVEPKDATVTNDEEVSPDIVLKKDGTREFFEFSVIPAGDPYLSFLPVTPDGVKHDTKEKALSVDLPFVYPTLPHEREGSPVVIKAQSYIPNAQAVQEDHLLSVGYHENGANVSEVIFADNMGVDSFTLNPGTDNETYGIVVPYAVFSSDNSIRKDKIQTAMHNAGVLYRVAEQKAPDEFRAFNDRFTELSKKVADFYKQQQFALEQMLTDKQRFAGLHAASFFQAFDQYDPATNVERYPKNANFDTAEGFFRTVSATLATNFSNFSEYVKTLPPEDRKPIRDVANGYLDLVTVTAGYNRRNLPLVVQNYNELMALFNG